MSQTTQIGYQLLKKFVTSSELDMLGREYDVLTVAAKRTIAHVERVGSSLSAHYRQNREQLIVVPEASDPREPCRFEYMTGVSLFLRDVVVPRLSTLIDSTRGERFVLFKDKCNVKRPGGGAFRPHQDFPAYRRFPPRFHITAAIMLDDSTIENGCLEMATEYQRFGDMAVSCVDGRFGAFPIFPYHEGGEHNGDIVESVCSRFEWDPITGRSGDVILFDSFVPHRSSRNRSNCNRRQFFFTFTPASDGEYYEEYYAAKRLDYGNPIFHMGTPTNHDAVTS